jgi:hypothetical protein
MTRSHFKIDPNPPVAGQPVQVTYEGPSTEVAWQVDGMPPKTVSVPPKTFIIPKLPAGRELCLSDGEGGPMGYLCALIDDILR